MTDERLKDFPPKLNPVAADIVYVGDSADTFNEVQSTISEIIAGYSAGLASIASLTTAADKMIYTTALNVYAVTSLTTFARSLLDDSDAATARNTLGLAIGVNVQAYDDTLQGISATSPVADEMLYATGADTFATTSLTSFSRTLLASSDALAARAELGVTNLIQSINTVVFATNDTYTPSAGVSFVDVQIIGGGGGGGGALATPAAYGGAGGGAGAYAQKRFTLNDVSPNVIVTVGSGGNGGNSDPTSPTGGTDGGSTSFGTLLAVTGGIAGEAGSSSATPLPGVGGDTDPSADFGQDGGSGGFGFSDGFSGCPGMGAASYFGGGVRANSPGFGAVGSGGGGGFNGFDGAPGGPGFVIVTEYISL